MSTNIQFHPKILTALHHSVDSISDLISATSKRRRPAAATTEMTLINNNNTKKEPNLEVATAALDNVNALLEDRPVAAVSSPASDNNDVDEDEFDDEEEALAPSRKNGVSSKSHRTNDNDDDDEEEDDANDKDQYYDDDDDDDEEESMDGLTPMSKLGWAILLVPFVLLTLAMAIAYVGRRKDAVAVELDPVDAGTLTVSDPSAKNSNHYEAFRYDHEQRASITAAGTSYHVTKQAAEQIENYHNDTALIVNVEIANHAGHAVCHIIGHAAGHRTPAKDCANLGRSDVALLKDAAQYYPAYYPWMYDETAANIAFVRQYFHLITWRFSHPSGQVQLADTDWEDSNLVSIMVIRDPLTRMLAHDDKAAAMWPAVFSNNIPPKDGSTSSHTPTTATYQDTVNQWWAFAKSPYTDNFALRALVGNDCCSGAQTSRNHLENAKVLLERFTFILDMECLEEGLLALTSVLQLPLKEGNSGPRQQPIATTTSASTLFQQRQEHPKPQDRIINTDVYHYLRSKNRLDIELYEWAKARSLVQCPTPQGD